jgi:hypothetical protein
MEGQALHVAKFSLALLREEEFVLLPQERSLSLPGRKAVRALLGKVVLSCTSGRAVFCLAASEKVVLPIEEEVYICTSQGKRVSLLRD